MLLCDLNFMAPFGKSDNSTCCTTCVLVSQGALGLPAPPLAALHC